MWSVPELARDALLWLSLGGLFQGNLSGKTDPPVNGVDLTQSGVVQGDYTGQYRPQIHFTPPKGYMNDPNGLHVDANGTWHLYYQLYPYAATPGQQHWGHATSPDLYHWINQPIAIYPPSKTESVYSGSAVLDPNNTSGFFPDQTDGVVAIYTLDTPTKEVQAVGYSRDGGYTFTPYEGNPVIDVNSRDFRDPKVLWYEDHWVMVVAYAADLVIGLYISDDLKHWKHSSNVSHVGLLVSQYECPNLVSVPVWENGATTGENVWMLWISGGGLPQYIPGDFDGHKFTPFDAGARTVDFAKDDYAGQFFFGTPSNETVSIHWAQAGGDYASVVPTGKEGWRSAMSLPRRHYMVHTDHHGWKLLSTPYDLSPVRGESLYQSTKFVNQTTSVDYSHTSGALYFQANFSYSLSGPIDSSMAFDFTFSSKTSGESVHGGYRFVGDQAWLDRGNTKGYGPDDPKFVQRFLSPQNARGWTVLGVIDRSMLELFVNDGFSSATMVYYAEEPLTKLDIGATGFPESGKVSLNVWELKSVW